MLSFLTRLGYTTSKSYPGGLPVRKRTQSKTRTSRERRFAAAVKVQLRERNKTLRSVADQMSVPVERVRQWLVRNVFPADGLVQLAAAVGLPTKIEELKRS